MNTKLTPVIRDLTPADEPQWRELYRAYREFYQLEPNEDAVTTAWQWLLDPNHESSALVAEADGEILGLAHIRPVPSLYTGTTGLFLDDLFTVPAARGRGVGRALIRRLTELAADEGYDGVQWITADDNAQAQVLYDDVATKTTWVTYEAAPTPR